MKILEKRSNILNISQNSHKIVFFGVGSIGRRHIKLIRQSSKCSFKIYALRSGKSKSPTPDGVVELTSWKQIKEVRPDIAFICNPTSLHIPTALKCVRQNMHLFLEKPIGHSTKGLCELRAEIKKRKLTAYVAYQLRFHPGIQRLRDLFSHEKQPCHVRCLVATDLSGWRPGTNHRTSYSAIKNMGGGVILDLSHEFDLIQYIFGTIKNMTGISGKLSHVTIDSEDYTNTILLAGNSVINLHMNLFSVRSQRKFEIDLPGKFIKFDLLNGTLETEDKMGPRSESFSVERDAAYIKQLDYFFNNLHNPKLMNNLNEASLLFSKGDPI